MYAGLGAFPPRPRKEATPCRRCKEPPVGELGPIRYRCQRATMLVERPMPSVRRKQPFTLAPVATGLADGSRLARWRSLRGYWWRW